VAGWRAGGHGDIRPVAGATRQPPGSQPGPVDSFDWCEALTRLLLLLLLLLND